MTDQRMTLITQNDVEDARKIKMLLPYGDKLTDDNALALKAYSRLHGLDPFNGECYFLVKEKKNERGDIVGREELGVYPGIKGKRKKSKEQLTNADPQAWYKCDYETVDPSETGLKAGSDIALVVKATLRDSISGGRYIVDTIKLKQAGLTKAEIEDIIGKSPVWIGYGVVKTYELRYIKQTPLGLAKKRAESDATNQRFDLPFANEALADDVAPDVVGLLENGDNPREDPVIVEGEVRTVSENMNALGYDDEPEPEPETPKPPAEEKQTTPPGRPYQPEEVKNAMAVKAGKHPNFTPSDKQLNLLRYGLELCFDGQESVEDKRHTLLHYLTGNSSTKAVTGSMFKAILEDWLQMKQDSGGQYQINQYAAQEAQKIVSASLVGEGQHAFA